MQVESSRKNELRGIILNLRQGLNAVKCSNEHRMKERLNIVSGLNEIEVSHLVAYQFGFKSVAYELERLTPAFGRQ